MGLSSNLVPFPPVKNPKNSFSKDFKHRHQAEMRQRPRECVWEVCGSCVFKKTLKSKEQVKLSNCHPELFLLAGTLSQTQEFQHLNGKAVMEVVPQLQGGEAHHTSPTKNHNTKEGRQKFSIPFLPGYGFHSAFICLKSHAWLPSPLTTGRQLCSAGKEVFLEIQMKNHTQQDGWWGELK